MAERKISFVEAYRADLIADLTEGMTDPAMVSRAVELTNTHLDEKLQRACNLQEHLRVTGRLVRDVTQMVPVKEV